MEMKVKDAILVMVFALVLAGFFAHVGYGWGVKETRRNLKDDFGHVLNFADRPQGAEVGDIILAKDSSVMIFTEEGWRTISIEEIPPK
jgi:hypothetical protein